MNDEIAVELRGVTKRFGEVTAVDRMNLRIGDGEFFSLLGPSGCGKTTTLRMVAGFEMPTEGQVYIQGQPMGHTPPFQRNVNTVFQNYALFPHINVARNIAFGLEMKNVARSEIEQRVEEALEMVRLPGMGRRRPSQLSGGQQQRVALARALINHPAVLLLDEPLGALDLKLRKEMQLELKSLQERVGITFIYVTHDQEEALTMSDRIAVMDRGLVLQVGRPDEIYERPNCRFVAGFIGETNFLDGTLAGRARGLAEVRLAGGRVVRALDRPEARVGQAVTVAIRPERMSVSAERPGEGEGVNALRAEIEEMIYTGMSTVVQARLADGTLLSVRLPNVASTGFVVSAQPNGGGPATSAWATVKERYHGQGQRSVYVTWPVGSGHVLAAD